MKTILHIAADPLINLGIERYLQSAGFKSIALPSLAGEFDLTHIESPDGVILDGVSYCHQKGFFESNKGGLSLWIHRLKQHWPRAGLIVRMDHLMPIEPLVKEIFSNGYMGIAFITSTCSLTCLQQAIDHALEGYLYVDAHPPSADSKESFFHELPEEMDAAIRYVVDRLPLLSPREMEVATHLYQEISQISLETGLTRRTVSHYIDSIYGKVGLKEPPQSLQHYRRATLLVLAIMSSKTKLSRLADLPNVTGSSPKES